MAISRCRPLPSIVICHAQWLWHRPVDHSAGPSAHLTNRRRCPESTPEARKTSITSPSAIFFGLGSRYPSPDRHLSPSSMRTSQPYMAWKLTAPPKMDSFSWAYSNMTMSMCLIFLPKTARDRRQHDMEANFWTAPTAWFQGGNGPNSRGLTLPLSDFLLVLCGRILLDLFRAPDTSWKTTLKALGVKPQFSQQFFMGDLTELMMPKLCYKFS